MPELPTGTVTFLFTDLEGSTRLWEEHPDAMKTALARHDEILRNAVESHEGHIVKTTGDGLHAAFANARDAVVAAVEGQQALIAETWPLPEPLHVRMGIHTGAAEYRDGDYYGPAVNRAARLMSAAHGGQILLSLATEEVLSEALPTEVQLRDLGEHRLRDLARPQRIFQIVAPGLQTEFPPIHSIDAYPGNLPVQLTSFVGREDEIRKIGKALDEARLVTLTGVGGVGKSRLAIEVSAELLPQFRDGAWSCELAPTTDRAGIDQVVSLALGVPNRHGIPLDEAVLEFLRDKALLLLLDNCEHVLDRAGDFVAAVLQRCSTVRVLSTSREALGLPGERVVAVNTLAVPDATPSAAADNDAVRLFTDRALAARPDLEIDGQTAASIVDLCRRLDGIPLAIELAAARVVAMTPAEITRRLDERFRLLAGKRRGDVEHHQTLWATVEWSYRLLTLTEQRVFERLAVFAGSFDADGAEAVAADEDVEAWDVVESLGALTSKSMLTVHATLDATTRYEMLETLRQYALERLDERNGMERFRRAHASHYVTVADEIGAGLVGPDELAARRRMLREVDNFRGALTWSLASEGPDDVELGLRIVGGLAPEVSGIGLCVWVERAAELVAVTDARTRVEVLNGAAWCAIRRGAPDEGRVFAERALPEVFLHPSRSPQQAHSALSMIEAMAGRLDEAVAVSRELQRRAEAADPPDLGARITAAHVIATWSAALGDFETAREEATIGHEHSLETGSPSLIATSLFVLGLALEGHDSAAALAAFEECIELTRAGATDLNYVRALGAAARLHARDGNVRPALEALREGIQYGVQTGQRTEIVAAIDRGIAALSRLGFAEEAATFEGIALFGPLAELNVLTSSPVVERRRELVRDALGDETYGRSFARGAAMTYEEIVDYTVSELERLIEETS